MLTIYNTLTRKKEEFKPLHPGVVNMYVCGPTVYNYIHIGNARSAIAFDTVRRYLEFKGYKVNYVSNFTDVDDKMIKAAAEQGITVPQLAENYINAFMEERIKKGKEFQIILIEHAEESYWTGENALSTFVTRANFDGDEALVPRQVIRKYRNEN